MDLRRTAEPLGRVLPGYGLTRASARERAAVVRAVTRDTHIRQRPMPVVVVTALAAAAGLAVFGWQLYLVLSEEAPAGPLLWAGLALFLIAAAICSWAWQLYDVRKAIVMWIAIAALSLAAVVIIAVVLVALKGDSDVDLDLDLDDLVGKVTGEGARTTGRVVDQVVVPVALDMADAAAVGAFDRPLFGDQAQEDAALARDQEQAPPGVPACLSCGRALTPGLRVCPRCGAAIDDIG